MRHNLRFVALVIIGLAVISGRASADPVIFSQGAGMAVPETIALAPAGFGAYGGSYFVPDASNGNIYVISSGGGTPGIFATNLLDSTIGGVFLPDNWGADAGKLATVGYESQTGRVRIYDSSGSSSLFAEVQHTTYITPMIAPAGFGTYGGDLLITADGQRGLVAVAPDGSVTTIVEGLAFRPFGLAYVPSGFGSFGGQVLVSSAESGDIFAIAADGTVTPFTTLPLIGPDQSGLRQMAFSPDGFIPGFGSLLFVSVTGSDAGGGTLGDILALDSSGDIVASLRQVQGLTKFDPRGLLFEHGDLLISDASDPILLSHPQDFQRVPEPSTLALALGALALLGLVRVRCA